MKKAVVLGMLFGVFLFSLLSVCAITAHAGQSRGVWNLASLPCTVKARDLSCTLTKNHQLVIVKCEAVRYPAVYPPQGPQPPYRCIILRIKR